jgi:hypothetical protein
MNIRKIIRKTLNESVSLEIYDGDSEDPSDILIFDTIEAAREKIKQISKGKIYSYNPGEVPFLIEIWEDENHDSYWIWEK